jgi:hypothetical protein
MRGARSVSTSLAAPRLPTIRKESFMAQNSSPSNPSPADAPHSAIVGDPASGTVDVDEGEKVSTVGTVAARLERLDAVDLLRGLVMVIMALDHTRDFFHEGAFLYPPEDLTRTTPLLFFTRWITHFCAPARFFITFGRVPLFYYLLHVPLIHLTTLVFDFVRYRRVVFDTIFATGTPPPGYGYSLAVVYLIWLCVVLALYPVCRWFAGVKARRRDAWLSYL